MRPGVVTLNKLGTYRAVRRGDRIHRNEDVGLVSLALALAKR